MTCIFCRVSNSLQLDAVQSLRMSDAGALEILLIEKLKYGAEILITNTTKTQARARPPCRTMVGMRMKVMRMIAVATKTTTGLT